ncbi:ankyrin repeat and LEM domain-containing protein 1 isoform X2 [Oenanthe melanoleuca]|uniref:ankyrin repeat and LEM domain-containing protein 1 isoform X2 n=1 Tax=Oenanthe melanoleuca TaxID=2939378 RepID=UPI0024C1464B|nr:ankyrin repeat and LEM domain-containing protein 1 isoform X2 [Oenanthe melanoleuca]
MSPRPPGVAVTSPPRRCVTPGDRDATGGSWGDTQTVPGVSPGGGSAPKSVRGVLRGLGDKGHPQNCPGSGPRGFGDKGHPQNCSGCPRGFGDKGHPQNCSGCPRGFGDKGHPQNSLPPARGSPKSSRGLPGKRRHPQKSPPVTRGPPSATSSPRTAGGTGWRRHSPLGTPSVPVSPGKDLGTPSVPVSPGCATPHSQDVTREPRECRSPGGGTGGRASQPELGDNPGAVTALEGQRGWPEGHSPELAAALRTGRVPDCAREELALSQHFGGERLKISFNYLLLDPSPGLSPAQQFRDFVTAVFYVGKGTRARPWWHLRQARAQHGRGTRRGCPKVRRILEIWDSGQGVVPLLCFPHRAPAEALTRESCMLEALGLPSLTNARRGQCHGPAASWPGERRRRLGVTLLHRALGVLLAQGECQLGPGDIPG